MIILQLSLFYKKNFAILMKYCNYYSKKKNLIGFLKALSRKRKMVERGFKQNFSFRMYKRSSPNFASSINHI